MSQLSIGLILPEVLGTYGDDGNALVLRQRARMRDIDAEIVPIHLGDPVPNSLDLYCLGGGEDTAQILAAEHLQQHQGLQQAAAKNTPILAICAGFQVLGESFRADNRIVAGIGLIDATTASLNARAIGELRTTPSRVGATSQLTQPLIGFENHMGATILGPDAQPLGQVASGVGNTDEFGAKNNNATLVGTEGAVQGSVICTYMHGPALARNPELADLLLANALGIQLSELEPLEIPVVSQLRTERLAVTE